MSTATAQSRRDTTPDQPTRAIHPGALGVLLLEEDSWHRSRVCQLLETEPGFRLAAVTESGREAVDMAKREQLAVAVVAHRPPSRSAFGVCRELKRLATPPAVVICSARPDGVQAACCLVAGADALMSRYDCDAQFSGVLDRVARGVRFLPTVPRRVGAMLHDGWEPAEHAMFSMLLAGAPAADLARGLRMSDDEVESCRSTLLRKLESLAPTVCQERDAVRLTEDDRAKK
jgi:DNA-binding NarL/FixJ family response regulator